MDLTDSAMAGAKFKFFVPMLKSSKSPDGKMRLSGIASSTVRDLHGDRMTESALADMERAARNNLTIFLNHEYKVPEDVAGSVETATIRRDAEGTALLVFESIVINEVNQRAVDAWTAIDNGTKLGLSIGAMIPDGGAKFDKKANGWVIEHIELLETSLVGVPANPRSWVDYAVKALNARKNITPEADGPRVSFEMVVDDVAPTVLADMIVEGLAEEIELDLTDAKKPATHTHAHAHAHDHEHSHGYPGESETVHSHAHAHQHSHDHGEDHEHEDTMNDGSHDHWHNGAHSGDGDDAHAHKEAEGLLEAEVGEDGIVTKATVWIETKDETITIQTDQPDTTESVEPEVQDAGTNIGSDAEGETTPEDSQEAPSSDPETEDDSGLLDESGPGDDAVLGDDVTKALEDALGATIVATLTNSGNLVTVLLSELGTARSERDEAIADRDAAIALTEQTLVSTKAILDLVKATPMGRRTIIRDADAKFSALEGVISPEALKILNRKKG
jgi:phage head maturation protease